MSCTAFSAMQLHDCSSYVLGQWLKQWNLANAQRESAKDPVTEAFFPKPYPVLNHIFFSFFISKLFFSSTTNEFLSAWLIPTINDAFILQMWLGNNALKPCLEKEKLFLILSYTKRWFCYPTFQLTHLTKI